MVLGSCYRKTKERYEEVQEMERGRKNKMKIILVIVYLILSMSGLILIKMGGNAGSFSVTNKNINFGINIISLIGMTCYITSFLLYTRMVVIFDLSYITPICTGIIQILTLVSSKIIFKEQINAYGLIGAGIVILGIIVMNWRFFIKES